jgi:hypothetical protein
MFYSDRCQGHHRGGTSRQGLDQEVLNWDFRAIAPEKINLVLNSYDQDALKGEQTQQAVYRLMEQRAILSEN